MSASGDLFWRTRYTRHFKQNLFFRISSWEEVIRTKLLKSRLHFLWERGVREWIIVSPQFIHIQGLLAGNTSSHPRNISALHAWLFTDGGRQGRLGFFPQSFHWNYLVFSFVPVMYFGAWVMLIIPSMGSRLFPCRKRIVRAVECISQTFFTIFCCFHFTLAESK